MSATSRWFSPKCDLKGWQVRLIAALAPNFDSSKLIALLQANEHEALLDEIFDALIVSGYQIDNPSKDPNVEAWYSCVMGSFCNPMLHEERTLGLPVPSSIEIVDAFGQPKALAADATIVGAVCLDKAGKEAGRFSWSNAKFMKHQQLSLSDDGVFSVSGDPRLWQVFRFVEANKNRLIGRVMVCDEVDTPTARPRVEDVELADLAYRR